MKRHHRLAFRVSQTPQLGIRYHETRPHVLFLRTPWPTKEAVRLAALLAVAAVERYNEDLIAQNSLRKCVRYSILAKCNLVRAVRHHDQVRRVQASIFFC